MRPNLRLEFVARHLKVVVLLNPEPEFGRGTKVTGEPKRGFTGYTAPALDDLSDAIGRNVQLIRKLVHAHTERLKEFLE